MKFCLFSINNPSLQAVVDRLSTFGEVVIYNDSLFNSDLDNVDIVVSIGGDGTLLRASQIALKHDLPLVGINAGHLGYLCAFKINELDNITLSSFENLKESHRTLLEYNNELAVNDVCLLKLDPSQSIEVDVKNVAIWKGDGVIFSTATGSTSYNQSAGGPILNSLSKDIVVTPICPHFSNDGYKVFSNENTFEAEIIGKGKAVISCDGRVLGPVEGKIIIKKSNKTLRLLSK